MITTSTPDTSGQGRIRVGHGIELGRRVGHTRVDEDPAVDEPGIGRPHVALDLDVDEVQAADVLSWRTDGVCRVGPGVPDVDSAAPMALFRRAPRTQPAPRRALPPPGVIRRERRLVERTREEKLRDLGGLMLEMYRRDTFREDLLTERCNELLGLDARLHELDEMLAAARRQDPRRALRVRSAAALELALLPELRPAGRRAGGRRLPRVRASASGRRALLRELRNRRTAKSRGGIRSGNRARARAGRSVADGSDDGAA